MRSSQRLHALPASLLLLLSASTIPTAWANPHIDTTDGFVVEVTKPVTCSRPTQPGDYISVHYRGTLQSDGTEFDESYKRGAPFSFKLGAGQVITGWDKGLLNMCVGEGRKLVIPPSMAYGNSRVGTIPAGSTLVFETELMGIKGVPVETLQSTSPATTTTITTTASNSSVVSTPTAAVTPVPTEGSEAGPKGQEEQDNASGECRLLGPFALVVQAALGAIALLSLVFKRWRERPRRPVKVWFFDVSKQVLGTFLLHLANLGLSMFSSGNLDAENAVQASSSTVQAADGRRPNPCSFYLLNLAIDTTIGIPVLVILLRVLHGLFLRTPLANPPESIKSGNYGEPPYHYTWWMKQALIYFIGLFCMKLFVFFLFQAMPWLAWVGDWALRWTEGSEALQIAFVMFIFPVAMNAIQYYIIDSFIKKKETGDREGFERVPSEESHDGDADDDDYRRGSEDSVGEEAGRGGKGVKASTKEHLAEANPVPVPVYESNSDGESSSQGSKDGAKNSSGDE